MIDTHAHLTDKQFSEDFYSVLKRAKEAGVHKIITVGTNFEDSTTALQLSQQFENIFSAIGVHPHEASSRNEDIVRFITSNSRKIIAIGEIGLDYYYDFSPKKNQRLIFEEQLELAVLLNKPVIIHCREAYQDLISILKSFSSKNLSGVIHCFTGTPFDASMLLSLGYYVSFGGMLTFKNAEDIRRIFLDIPVDRLILETDCPYLSPVPFRGKRNEPSFIRYVYEKASFLKSIPLQDLKVQIRKNVENLFQIN